MLKGFRDFILRGNVVDLAVAVIIGTAFGAVVTAFTKGIIMQFVAATRQNARLRQACLQPEWHPHQLRPVPDRDPQLPHRRRRRLLLRGGAVELLARQVNKPAPAAAPTTKTCGECLSEIPLEARRCKFCAQPVA